MEKEDKSPQEQMDEFFTGMHTFMENTNIILAQLKCEIDNMGVDVSNLKKHLKKKNDNNRLIIA